MGRNPSLHLLHRKLWSGRPTSAGSVLPYSEGAEFLDPHINHWILAIRLGWRAFPGTSGQGDSSRPSLILLWQRLQVCSLRGTCTASVAHGDGHMEIAREIPGIPAGIHLHLLTLQCLPGLWHWASHLPSLKPQFPHPKKSPLLFPLPGTLFLQVTTWLRFLIILLSAHISPPPGSLPWTP